jgi:ectoine hydroxylase-related dioxygenase (phytanoyl-CoA dioxygenase family)
VRPTEAELTAGRLDDDTLAIARTVFGVTGFLLVEAVVPLTAVEACRRLVQEELRREDRTFLTFPEVDGIGTTFFDFEGPFADPAIVANPILLQLLGALVAPEFTCSIYNTNISMPGTSRDQPVHVDVPTSAPPHASVHVTLCEFTEANGSTELWPGTHRHPTEKSDDLEAAARELPSVRANLPAGSLIIRNASTWHRGRTNATSVPREMLSMFFAAKGTDAEGTVYGRKLAIDPAVLDALPAAARPVWAINQAPSKVNV